DGDGVSREAQFGLCHPLRRADGVGRGDRETETGCREMPGAGREDERRASRSRAGHARSHFARALVVGRGAGAALFVDHSPASVQHADGSAVKLRLLFLVFLPFVLRAEPQEIASSLTLEQTVDGALRENAQLHAMRAKW